jgi:hypothetical protein
MQATLRDVRDRIESLASDVGRYRLVCARTGETPVPVAGLSFESREIARNAAREAERYRSALRRYDDGLAHHDLIVCERSGGDR